MARGVSCEMASVALLTGNYGRREHWRRHYPLTPFATIITLLSDLTSFSFYLSPSLFLSSFFLSLYILFSSPDFLPLIFLSLMLHNTLTDNRMGLFCLVDGENTSNAFSIKIPSNETQRRNQGQEDQRLQ